MAKMKASCLFYNHLFYQLSWKKLNYGTVCDITDTNAIKQS